MKKILYIVASSIITFSFCFLSVFAEGENNTGNWESEYLFQINGNPNYNFKAIWNGNQRLYSATGTINSGNSSALQCSTPIYALRFFEYNSNSNYPSILFYYYDDEKSVLDSGNLYFRVIYADDGLNWQVANYGMMGNTYQYSGAGQTGRAFHYAILNQGQYTSWYYANDVPIIRLTQGTNLNTIYTAISVNANAPFPWYSNTNDGTTTFPDGITLAPQYTTQYEQVYVIMDVNKDNSVTQEEVNYYNVTYNTNYDYSEINNNQDFSELEFLYWVATEINNGNDNPGGGSGSGGNGGITGGGITVTDSFTQSQTQSIAENAVNVTINNDGSINNDNSQFINSVINNNLAGEGATNAFETALGTVSSFVNVGQSFASLASAVLGFLPAWVTTLLSLMFTLLFVMVVFRLIHLFI